MLVGHWGNVRYTVLRITPEIGTAVNIYVEPFPGLALDPEQRTLIIAGRTIPGKAELFLILMTIPVTQRDGQLRLDAIAEINTPVDIIPIRVIQVAGDIMQLGHHIIVEQGCDRTDKPIVAVVFARKRGVAINLFSVLTRRGGGIGIQEAAWVGGAGIAPLNEIQGVLQTERKRTRTAFDLGGETVGLVIFNRRIVVEHEIGSVHQRKDFQDVPVSNQGCKIDADLQRHRRFVG